MGCSCSKVCLATFLQSSSEYSEDEDGDGDEALVSKTLPSAEESNEFLRV